ncbi:MAG TPA: glycosyltransferase [Chryseosolibacter sp.]|nr:glycosyltransferase [Chryseosolibacter sp.]
MKPGVSIIICCHNGARRLPETVRHIAEQEVSPDVRWEFVLVDNNSTDGSADVASDAWDAFGGPVPITIVTEEHLGLMHARRAGFAAAQYEFVVMCDDDNWLDSSYVQNVFDIMTDNASIGALGGFGKLIYEIHPPKYIEYSNIFAGGPQASKNGKVYKNRVYGAGCVIRKSAYEELMAIGFSSLLTDRKGMELSSGGDYELCYALSILGYDIWYDDRLRFSHFITMERLNWQYFLRYARESAICFDVLASYGAIADDSSINEVPFAFISRNFFYSFRHFVRINLKRMVYSPDSDMGKSLFFRHTILKFKLSAYVTQFAHILRIHRQILEFKKQCAESRMFRIKSIRKRLQLFPLRLLPF